MGMITKAGGESPPKPKLPTTSFVVTIPGEMEAYAPHIRRFVEAMVYKLKLNAHKGMWDGYSENKAIGLLCDEVAELDEAVEDGNMVEVMLEAADVANFAMIVSAIAIGGRK